MTDLNRGDAELPPAKRMKLNDSTDATTHNVEHIHGQQSATELSKKGNTSGGPNSSNNHGWVRAEDGLHGVIVSCDLNREPKCTKEMLELLNEIAEQYFPAAGAPASELASDIVSDLHKELEILKSGASRRFFAVQTNCKNMVFIRFAEETLDPIVVVNKIFDHVLASGEGRTRFTNKIIPICKTAPSFLDRLVQIAKPMIQQHFHRTPGKVLSFMVEYRHRYTDSIRKDDSTKELVRLVGRPHRVDLNNPDKIIIVEVFNKALGMSIVNGDDYKKFKAYNLRQITEHMPRRFDADDSKPSLKPLPDETLEQAERVREKSLVDKSLQPRAKVPKQQRWQQEEQEAEQERKRSVETIPVRCVSESGTLELDLEFDARAELQSDKDDDEEPPFVYDLSKQSAVKLL